MSPHLSVFRVPDAAEVLYRRVLRSATAGLDTHAAELGWSLEETTAAAQALIAVKLVRETTDGQILVEHPRAALERLIEVEEARLEGRRRELSEARSAIATFTADHRVGQEGDTDRRPGWESVPVQVLPSVAEHLVRSTTGLIRNCVVSLPARAQVDVDALRTGQAAVAAGRERRGLYPFGWLDSAPGRRWMRSWADVGEQQRVSDKPPSDFWVFGSEVVVAVADWGSSDADYVLIRDPMIVEAFASLFDLAWSGALPVPEAAEETDDDRRLLMLLAGGFKDEAIARYLGWGVRTVRRRVANLMAELGADTRFQLGVAAERRRMLARGREPR